ncbi:hypothetical protein ES703_15604 [subsurface metagenome]
MGQDNLKFPKIGVGAHQPEQIWRDFEMFNIHINAHKQRWLKDVIDIIDAHRFEDDFCGIPTDGVPWDLPVPGGYSCMDAVNGVLLLDTTASDPQEMVQICECWRLDNCYPLYGEIRFRLPDVTTPDFWFGYISDATAPPSFYTPPTDYVVFRKDAGDAILDFVTELGGVPTTTTGAYTLVNNIWYRLGIHWDGAGTIRYFVIQDGDFPQTVLAAGSHTTNIPILELAFGFGVQGTTMTLQTDYVKSVQKRVI